MLAQRFTFRIKITKLGYLFISLCLGIGIAALNSGNNLLYLLFAMMLSFLILSGLLSNSTLSGIHLSAVFPPRVFAQKLTRCRLHITNNKRWFSSYAITLRSKSEASISNQNPFVVKLAARQKMMLAHSLIFGQRGEHPLPNFIVETTYPFGLLNKYTQVVSHDSRLVYPAIVSMRPWLEQRSQFFGHRLSQKKDSSGSPYGLRDFVYGDHYRHIHWRTSAKRNDLHIKEFESESKMRFALELCLLPQEITNSSAREQAISLCASLVMTLTEQQYPIRLTIAGHMIGYANPSIDLYLTHLAKIKTPVQFTMPAPPAKDSIAILITDHPTLSVEGFDDIIRSDIASNQTTHPTPHPAKDHDI